jgi:hypothetical protein
MLQYGAHDQHIPISRGCAVPVRIHFTMLTVGGGATLPHKLAGIGMKAVGPLPTYLDKVSLNVHTMQFRKYGTGSTGTYLRRKTRNWHLRRRRDACTIILVWSRLNSLLAFQTADWILVRLP